MHIRSERQNHPRVAIVGGGAAGVSVATHLAGAFDPALDLRVDLFEPGGTLGRGIAYSTTDERHLLNVPAKGMSLYRDDMSHFQNWAGAQPDEFVSRARYGDYLQSALRTAWRRRCGRFRHVREEVVDVLSAPGGGWLVIDSAGQSHHADAVVLATGHQAPEAPEGLSRDVIEAEGFHTDPWGWQSIGRPAPGRARRVHRHRADLRGRGTVRTGCRSARHGHRTLPARQVAGQTPDPADPSQGTDGAAPERSGRP